MQNPNFDPQSAACIQEMICWHYNHPSIFLWGLLNECASDTAYGRACYQKQFRQVQSLDLFRPVTSASCKPWPHWLGEPSEAAGDLCLDLPDVISYNIYPGWYHDAPGKEYIGMLIDGIQSSAGKGKPIIISEIGAGGIYGFRSFAQDKWSEERQADIVDQQLTALFARDELAGVFIWQLCDCRGDEELFYYRPKCMNNKGVMDEYRRPKLVYNVVKRHFHSAKEKEIEARESNT
jgi:beta-glucuronidase